MVERQAYTLVVPGSSPGVPTAPPNFMESKNTETSSVFLKISCQKLLMLHITRLLRLNRELIPTRPLTLSKIAKALNVGVDDLIQK